MLVTHLPPSLGGAAPTFPHFLPLCSHYSTHLLGSPSHRAKKKGLECSAPQAETEDPQKEKSGD